MPEELFGRFKDKTGREWIVDLDVDTCRRVRKECGVDLANFHDGNSHRQLWESDEKLVDVLWELVSEQAAKASVDASQFAKSLNGDALAAGLEAIQAAVVGFTRPDRRELARQIQDKAKTLTAKLVEQSAAQLASEKLAQQMDAAVARHANKIEETIAKALSTAGS